MESGEPVAPSQAARRAAYGKQSLAKVIMELLGLRTGER